MQEWTSGSRVGRYELVEPIGRGGVGLVWRAWDPERQRDVAVKVLRVLDAGLARRQVREAALQAQIDSPHVVRVLDALTVAGVPVLVMELVGGPTLLALLKEGRLPLDAVDRLAAQLLAGLQAIHEAGIVHRDLKPGNILLAGPPGRRLAQLTDFGLARPLQDDEELTLLGTMLGTPGYMAPEQIVDPRQAREPADLFALGVILFRMVTGTLPFRAPDRFEVMRRTRAGDRPTVAELRPDAPARMVAAIDGALRSQPERRPATAAAMAAIWAGEAALDADPDVEPTAPAISLDVPDRPSAPGVPVPAEPLVGRQPELRAVADARAAGRRLITLLGTAGVGKTRVALAVAGAEGEAWWVDLEGLGDEAAALTAVARALGVGLHPRDPQQGLADEFRKRSGLLVLDGAGALAAAVGGLVSRWLAQAPGLTVIASSRVLLGARGEAVVEVGPLPLEDAVALFARCASALRPGFRLDDGNREAVQGIVQRVDRLPLAVELAAARTRLLPPQRLLERWDLGLIRGRGGPLDEAIDGSWSLLAPWAQVALAQCSVFRGGFTLDAAEDVIDLAGFDRAPWPMDVVQLLVDHSVVACSEPIAGHERFRLYEPVRGFAADRLGQPDAVLADDGRSATGPEALAGARLRHARTFARLGARRAMRPLTGRGGASRVRSLDLERENLLAAHEAGLDADDGTLAAGCALALAYGFRLHGPYAGGAALVARTLRCAGLGAEDRARLHRQAGRLELLAGDRGAAAAALDAAQQAFDALGDRRSQGIVLGNLADLDCESGQLDRAEDRYRAALAALRAVGDVGSEAVVLGNLANLLRGRGDPQARASYEEALALSRRAGDQRAICLTLGNLAGLHLDAGRLEVARAAFDEGIAIARTLGDHAHEGLMQGNRALLDQQRGDPAAARAGFEAAIELAQRAGSRRIEGLHRGNLGDLLWAQGDLAAAREQLEQAVALGDELWPLIAGAFRGSLAAMAAQGGDAERARRLFDEGERLLDGVDADELRKLRARRVEAEV